MVKNPHYPTDKSTSPLLSLSSKFLLFNLLLTAFVYPILPAASAHISRTVASGLVVKVLVLTALGVAFHSGFTQLGPKN